MKGDRRNPSIHVMREQTSGLLSDMADEELADVCRVHAANESLDPGVKKAITAELRAEVTRRKAALTVSL